MSSQPLWHGRFEAGPSPELTAFSESLSFDRRLWADDIAGSRAHVAGLESAGLLSTADADALRAALDTVHAEFAAGAFLFSPTDEDIHTAVERRVTELAGDAGARIHTGRSRNDQVATDLRLFVRRELRSIGGATLELAAVLLDRAEPEIETPLPGFTHLQAAQPVSLAHHLMAHAHGLLRDLDRLSDALRRADVSPLGAGALGGSTLPLRPEVTADALGFAAIFSNSMDAVSDRDFVADALYALAMLGVRLSKMGEEVVLWTSDGFGWARLDESWSTGSSMLPQKKNPDIAELARGKSGRLLGALSGFLATLKGLPLAYNRDLQEDKEPLFDSLDQVARALPAVAGLYRTLQWDRARMSAAADNPYLLAIDVAEALVLRGEPFRRAHARVAALVRQSLESGADFPALCRDHLDVQLDPGAPAALLRRRSPGGAGPLAVQAQTQALRARLEAERARLKD
ncbi:MAG: argininosuccinate lyase [Proteobacteria bacterium]|nr:argininosuccinate lyase [Pseudomonadota bacterium]